jgi:hypothetical protein
MVSEHIEQPEGVCYVPGTRISLDSIVYAFREGCSPETIREDYRPMLPPPEEPRAFFREWRLHAIYRP